MRKTSVADRIVTRLQVFTEALEKGEPVVNRFTCKRIKLDLKPQPYTPSLVRETRKVLRASQVVFAHFLGVSPQTVRAWEQGKNIPNDIAARFMDEIRRNPKYWQERLRESIVAK